jgi:hypothetical protein
VVLVFFFFFSLASLNFFGCFFFNCTFSDCFRSICVLFTRFSNKKNCSFAFKNPVLVVFFVVYGNFFACFFVRFSSQKKKKNCSHSQLSSFFALFFARLFSLVFISFSLIFRSFFLAFRSFLLVFARFSLVFARFSLVFRWFLLVFSGFCLFFFFSSADALFSGALFPLESLPPPVKLATVGPVLGWGTRFLRCFEVFLGVFEVFLRCFGVFWGVFELACACFCLIYLICDRLSLFSLHFFLPSAHKSHFSYQNRPQIITFPIKIATFPIKIITFPLKIITIPIKIVTIPIKIATILIKIPPKSSLFLSKSPYFLSKSPPNRHFSYIKPMLFFPRHPRQARRRDDCRDQRPRAAGGADIGCAGWVAVLGVAVAVAVVVLCGCVWWRWNGRELGFRSVPLPLSHCDYGCDGVPVFG